MKTRFSCAEAAYENLVSPKQSVQRAALRARQRLAIARVLLQGPSWVFLEEATNALDPEAERLLIELLLRELPDATVLLISFRSDMSRHFTRSLRLQRVRNERARDLSPHASAEA